MSFIILKTMRISSFVNFTGIQSEELFDFYDILCCQSQSKFYKSTIYLKRIWKKLGRNIYVTKETANGKTHPSKNG